MQKYVKVYGEMREERHKEWDMFNFYLGRYIGLAVNAPKKYPSQPILHKEEMKEMTPEEMEEIAMRSTKILGGNIKK